MVCSAACFHSAEAIHHRLQQGCICLAPFPEVVDPVQLGLEVTNILFHILQNIFRWSGVSSLTVVVAQNAKVTSLAMKVFYWKQ